jgi:hypothetical protein
VPSLTDHLAQMTDAELVDAALAKWGGPVEVFADQIIGVNPSTLNRWRRGERKLNKRRRRQLLAYLTPPTT